MDKLKMGKGTIFENGYGIIPKSIMTSKDLSTTSKSIYAYLCSYADSENSAFPSVKKMMYDLDLSKDTFYKYMNELFNCGYVDKSQEMNENQFSHNVYNLQVINKTILANKELRQEALKNKESSSCPKIKESGINDVTCPNPSDTRISDTKSSDTRISTTINTNLKNTNLKNTKVKNNSNMSSSFNEIRDFWEEHLGTLNDLDNKKIETVFNNYGSAATKNSILKCEELGRVNWTMIEIEASQYKVKEGVK